MIFERQRTRICQNPDNDRTGLAGEIFLKMLAGSVDGCDALAPENGVDIVAVGVLISKQRVIRAVLPIVIDYLCESQRAVYRRGSEGEG